MSADRLQNPAVIYIDIVRGTTRNDVHDIPVVLDEACDLVDRNCGRVFATVTMRST
ncbi:hypothetical protein [Candidatus Rariloculus sp.]|uniref:hypothetical protein n=1 Tax=Candidatus Rariloculus sp. TaxID=3101265 RepID=UPI003D0D73B1